MWRAGDENALLLPTLVLKLTLASRASIVTVGNTISCFRMFFSLASLVPDTQSWRVHPDFTSYICNMVEIIRQSEDVTFPDQISPLGRVEYGTSLLRTFVVWTQLYWYFHIPTDHCRILQGMLTRLKDISIQLLHKCFHNEVAHVTLHTPTWLVFPEQWTTLRLLRVTEASLVIHHLTTAYSNSLYLTSVLFNCTSQACLYNTPYDGCHCSFPAYIFTSCPDGGVRGTVAMAAFVSRMDGWLLSLPLRLEPNVHLFLHGQNSVRTATNVCEGHATFWRLNGHKNVSQLKQIHFSWVYTLQSLPLHFFQCVLLLSYWMSWWKKKSKHFVSNWTKCGWRWDMARSEFCYISSWFTDTFILTHSLKLLFIPHI